MISRLERDRAERELDFGELVRIPATKLHHGQLSQNWGPRGSKRRKPKVKKRAKKMKKSRKKGEES